jgi:predicted Zn-dependent peptidase
MLMDVRDTVLPSGLRVITSRMPHVESASVGVWVGVGGRHEPAHLSGASHFIEHLLFKGTRHRTARQISEAVEGCGGDLNAFTQEESTCYHARVAAGHLWRAFDVLMDMVHHPRFDPDDITKERGVILEEIMMYRDQPQQQVEEWLGELLWRNHPLGRPLVGTPESLRNLTRRTIRAFKQRHYLPGSTVVAFAGKVEHETCVARAQRYYPHAHREPKPPCGKVNHLVGQGRVHLHSKAIEQTHLAMGIRLFGRQDPRRYALKLLNVILGENMSSRLFQVVREQYGLAYAIQSGMHLFHDTGVLGISAGLDRRRTGRAMDLIVREVTRLKTTPVSPLGLRRAKEYACGQIRLALEGTTSQLMWIGEHFMSYGQLITPEQTIHALEQVTADEVQKLSRDIIRKDRCSVAMIAPDLGPRDEREVKACLERLG